MKRTSGVHIVELFTKSFLFFSVLFYLYLHFSYKIYLAIAFWPKRLFFLPILFLYLSLSLSLSLTLALLFSLCLCLVLGFTLQWILEACMTEREVIYHIHILKCNQNKLKKKKINKYTRIITIKKMIN